MLRRDYLMRLIEEFAAALALALEKKEFESRREALLRLYDKYLGGRDRFHHVSLDEVMASVAEWPEHERLQRTEMLAELYHAESACVAGPERHDLAGKAYALYTLVCRHDRTYSFDRLRKMDELRRWAGEEQ